MSRKNTNTKPTYPALRNLEIEQQRVAEGLREGFRTKDELFFWLQDLIIVTFGYVDNQLLQESYTSGSLRCCLMTGDGFRCESTPHLDIDPWKAREFRLLLEEKLNSPFQSAYRELRARSNEYVDSDGRPDPTAEDTPVALRPSLDRLNNQQERVLREMLDGFEDDEEILNWERRLNSATFGEIHSRIVTGLRQPEAVLRDQLLNDEDAEFAGEYREDFRYHFAAVCLLPAFNNGVRTLFGTAGEQSDSQEDDGELVSELGA